MKQRDGEYNKMWMIFIIFIDLKTLHKQHKYRLSEVQLVPAGLDSNWQQHQLYVWTFDNLFAFLLVTRDHHLREWITKTRPQKQRKRNNPSPRTVKKVVQVEGVNQVKNREKTRESRLHPKNLSEEVRHLWKLIYLNWTQSKPDTV